MSRRRPASQHRQHRPDRDAERLVRLARGLAESGSRIEDLYWEGELEASIAASLAAGQDEPINLALDRLHEAQGGAYELLADLIEAKVGGDSVDTPEGPRHYLLIALPVLAWSRYAIPARALPVETLAALSTQLAAHVLAAEARLVLADILYSPDQIPYGYAETRRYAEALWRTVDAGKTTFHEDPAQLPEAAAYVSDVRYLLGALSVPAGRPVFRWNEADGSRQRDLEQWRAQGGPNLRPLLPGCSFELLLPEAYFAAWREADREGRPHALAAAVAYLQMALALEPAALQAVAAPFHDHKLVEWRIGLALRRTGQVVHGVVWPLLGTEDEGDDGASRIEEVLRQVGVGEVRILEQRFPLEYCEDCGAPLYPNAAGDIVHAEMPEEDAPQAPTQLH